MNATELELPGNRPVWVGQLDIATQRVTSVMGELSDRYASARLLLRHDGRAVSWVEVPVQNGTIAAEELARHSSAAAIEDHSLAVADNIVCPPSMVDTLTVAVCTRDRIANLERVFDDLIQLDPTLVTEILVIDNAPSSDVTRRFVEQMQVSHPRVRYVLELTPGLSAARNAGLRSARNRWVAFTDDDVRIDAHWPNMLMRQVTHPRVVCVTGLVAAAELENAPQQRFDRRIPWARRLEPVSFRLEDKRSALFPFDAGQFGTGANIALDRLFALGIGGFDETLGTGTPTKGGEDLDFLCRLVMNGAELIYEPSAIVWHPHPNTEQALRRQLHGYGMGLGAYLAKLALSRHSLAVFRRAPLAIVHLVRATGAKSDGIQNEVTASAPRADRWIEMRGVVSGAAAYVRTKWRSGR